MQDFPKDNKETAKELDFCMFELKEIDEANLKIGEDEELEESFRNLHNQFKANQEVQNVLHLLTNENLEIRGIINKAESSLGAIVEFDTKISEFYKNINHIAIDFHEFIRDICRYLLICKKIFILHSGCLLRISSILKSDYFKNKYLKAIKNEQ